MLETQNLPVVSIVNGQPTTLSTDISNFFEKPHNDVLKAIRAILSKLPEDPPGKFFGPAISGKRLLRFFHPPPQPQ